MFSNIDMKSSRIPFLKGEIKPKKMYSLIQWLEWWSPKRYIQVLTPGTTDVTLFGKRGFANIIH